MKNHRTFAEENQPEEISVEALAECIVLINELLNYIVAENLRMAFAYVDRETFYKGDNRNFYPLYGVPVYDCLLQVPPILSTSAI
jgi:hypothetical protein